MKNPLDKQSPERSAERSDDQSPVSVQADGTAFVQRWTNPVLAGLDMPPHLAEFIATRLGEMESRLAETSAEQIWNLAARCLAVEAAARVLAGRALMWLRETLPPREFSAGLAERNIPRSTAYYSIGASCLFASLPDLRSVTALGDIGVTKAMALRRLPPDQLVALTHGEEVAGLTIEQAADLSSREIEALVKEVTARDEGLKRAESETARLKAELHQLREQAKRNAALRAVEELPEFARRAREEAMHHADRISIAIELLEAVAEADLLADVKHPEAGRWQAAAARTLAFAVGAQLSRGVALIRRLQAHFGEQLTEALDADAILEPGEAAAFFGARERLLARALDEHKRRDDHRANTAVGKRGAPRGPRAGKK